LENKTVDGVKQLRTLFASYWQPIVGLLGGIPVAWEAVSSAGLAPKLSTLPSWFIVGLYVALIGLIRYPRVAYRITAILFPRTEDQSDDVVIFRGPRPFLEEDSNTFPGRKSDLDQCWLNLRRAEFFIIEGESGCGKSSFVRAGIISRLRAEHSILEIRVNRDPLLSLQNTVLSQNLKTSLTIEEFRERLKFSDKNSADSQKRVILIDQFEELFVNVRDFDRREFFVHLVAALSCEAVRVLIVVRSDFLDLVLRHCREVDEQQTVFDLTASYTLSAFQKARAETVIIVLCQPLYGDDALKRLEISRFAEALVADLMRAPRDKRLCPDDEKTVLPVEMQIMGMLLQSRGLHLLTPSSLHRLGGKAGLMRDYIREAATYVWRKTGVPVEQSLLILRALISQFDTKKAVTAAEIAERTGIPARTIEAVFGAYSDKFLVKPTLSSAPGDHPPLEDQLGFELVHDYVATILSESPEESLQRIRNAEARLAFWREHTDLAVSTGAYSPGRISKMSRMLRQSVPIGECISLWRYAVALSDRRLLGKNACIFGCKLIIAAALLIFPAGYVFREATINSGFVVLADGWEKPKESGFNFLTGQIVPFDGGAADIFVSNTVSTEYPNGWDVARFFTQQETGTDFDKAKQDKLAWGGLLLMRNTRFPDLTRCPETGYVPHWFPPDPPKPGFKERIEPGDVFCVRRRDGRSFAKIEVTVVEKHRIAFDWVFQRYPFLGFY
jgi:hypothetical protein